MKLDEATYLKLIAESAKTPVGQAVMMEDKLSDLGIDSMSVVNLIMNIEREFEIAFPAEYLNREVFETVGSLKEALDGIPT
jgi:acyl carrier protein